MSKGRMRRRAACNNLFVEAFSRFPQLVEENLAWFGVSGSHVPCLFENIIETRKLEQKKFKLEGSWPLRASIIIKEERTMIQWR
jgi:hypothetical protein